MLRKRSSPSGSVARKKTVRKRAARSAAETRAQNKRKQREAPPDAERVLLRLRKICLRLPEAEEIETWGHPTFRVRKKIFAGFDGGGSGATLGVKATFETQEILVETDPRFSIAPYVGQHGWVSMRLDGTIDWGLVEELVRDSYRLIVPKSLIKTLRNDAD